MDSIKNCLRPIVRPVRRRVAWFLKFVIARTPLALEDYVDYFALRHPQPFFIQIGAYDGVANDPIYRWANPGRWPGILVEPVPENMEKLKGNYAARPNLHLEEIAVAEESGARTFYRLSGGSRALPEWTAQLASFDRRTILSHRTVLPDIERYLVGIEVKTLTLKDLLLKHGIGRVDLMLVDCEGYDFEVVKQIASLAQYPEVLIYEHTHLPDPSECTAFLAGLGYASLRFSTDTLAFREGAFPPRLVRNAAVSRA